MLGFIFRCGKYFTNQSSMLLLYNALVRSRLEYCATVWNPIYAKYTDMIERVQRKFTRMFYYTFKMLRPDYDSRLKFLKLHSLQHRRLENDELVLFKIIHHHIDTSLVYKLSFHHYNRFNRHTKSRLFYLPNISTNIEENSPIYRIQNHHDDHFSNLNLMDDNLYSFKKLVRNQF